MAPKTVKLRALAVTVAFSVLFAALVVRLYWIQVVHADAYLREAQEIWNVTRPLKANRGAIYDRNGNLLAADGLAYTVAVNPSLMVERQRREPGLIAETAARLAGLIGKPASDIERVVREKAGAVWAELGPEGTKIDAGLAEKVLDAFGRENCREFSTHFYCGNVGVILVKEKKRYYPSGAMLAHVLGYVRKDDVEGGGLEYQFRDVLRGRDGSISYARDRKGVMLPNASVRYEPPQNGSDLVLTIDRTVQSFLETALESAFERWKPRRFVAIAADPQTMEILGMSGYPTFDPNAYWTTADAEAFRNPAVQWEFEPGSTFKIVTLAAAIEEGVWNPDETFKSGAITVSGQTIHDHNRSGWGTITYREGLLKSSNVAFVKLGLEKLGKDRLKSYIDRFGFGRKTGVELPAENAGRVDFRYPVEVATASFGQGITVTALQELVAVSAIANGGRVMKPWIVREIVRPDGTKQTFGPMEIGRAVSESTARQTALLLEQVVSEPGATGYRAKLDGYRIAGKTGTAQKVVNGRYADDRWVVSFVGFAPADRPKFALVVVADEPRISDYREAGEVAAPVFREIASQLLKYYGIEPRAGNPVSGGVSEVRTKPVAVAPDLIGKPARSATAELEQSDMPYAVLGGGSTVFDQFPKPGTEMGALQRIYLLTEPSGSVALPDMRGLSLREAMEICRWLGYTCTVEGQGYVVSQDMSTVDGQRTARLRFGTNG
ncbi:MAG: hypothetical protein BLM47_03005 [Candidatus Reconcilbacillus cellulovorans]|uniref:PASTA domain-containing protein n=1 Tax=Candidatus Reconcilbacillus cellulovorans TaxID=1906605 RepID=A0A2A6E2Z0_9BACL|nr:MAG: hypothetical protein BLM47_03005 [Candidatus Reconcilbacillus cellulovorans]